MENNEKIADGLRKNGTDLIKLGIQDADMAATNDDARRYLTAVLNVFAGMLLLLKSRLADASVKDNYALIYMKVDPVLKPDGSVGVRPVGRKTVDFSEIQKRMMMLGLPGLDERFWKGMQKLQGFRNDAEHYFAKMDETTCSANMLTVHDALIAICDFVLEESPQNIFGDEWRMLLKQADVAERLRNERDETMKGMQWINQRLEEMFDEGSCPKCGFQILSVDSISPNGKAVDSTFRCTACGQTFAYDELMEHLITTGSFDDYGGRWKDECFAPRHIGICPNCGRYAFDADTDTCYCCGCHEEYVCAMCGEKLTIDEIENNELEITYRSLCSHCRYLAEKDD